MLDLLRRELGLTAQGKARSHGTIGKVKGVATFFDDALKASEKCSAFEAVVKSCPWWLEALGKSAGESVPIIKFVLTVFSEMTKEPNPLALGFLASTVAYQRSVEESMSTVEAPTSPKNIGRRLEREWEELDFQSIPDFESFSLRSSLTHEFVLKADGMLRNFCAALGYDEATTRKCVAAVHHRYVVNLKTILSHGDTAAQFKPFTDFLSLGSEARAYDYLIGHVAYNKWLFEEAPLFQREAFSLSEIYIETECGVLAWGETRPTLLSGPGRRPPYAKDPFREQEGDRHDVLESVLEAMARKSTNDPIVVQGVAGSGKSSFTLRLSVELSRLGLVPLRVRLRDLSLDRHVSEALPRALFPADSEIPGAFFPGPVDDPFDRGAIFDQKVAFRGTEICPYVIILDGWDEISISVAEGFKVRMERMLEQIRSEYLRRAGANVKVILTGRPSVALEDSAILGSQTPLLTLRPIRPEQLRSFAGRLRRALVAVPPSVREAEGSNESGREVAPQWQLPSEPVMNAVFEKYEVAYNASVREKDDASSAEPFSPGLEEQDSPRTMEVLGLPLLSFLAMRLIAGERENAMTVIETPTTLFRGMIDLVCRNAAKFEMEVTDGINMVAGWRLRRLLHGTATAMTILGHESISYAELSKRLAGSEEADDGDLCDRVARLSEFDLTSLLVAFFFKGGNKSLGCEFLHKSFREYLFAEAVVEALKNFGREAAALGEPLRERLIGRYWQDFPPSDPRHAFSRNVAKALAPQWLRSEVVVHLEKMVSWEVARAFEAERSSQGAAEDGTSAPCSAAEWRLIRDGIADLWDWWGEGVHMRPQPTKRLRGEVEFVSCFADELIEFDLPFDRAESVVLAPARGTTMDSHLGDALFRLSCQVHFEVAKAQGWLARARSDDEKYAAEIWDGVCEPAKRPRRYQSVIKGPDRDWTVFAPGGESSRYFGNYAHRINAAAWRPSGEFPTGIRMFGLDLRGVVFTPHLDAARTDVTTFACCNMTNLKATGGLLKGVRIVDSLIRSGSFEGTYFWMCALENNQTSLANLSFCTFLECKVPKDIVASCLSPSQFSMCVWADGATGSRPFPDGSWSTNDLKELEKAQARNP